MSYCDASAVAPMVNNILSGSATFSDATSPTVSSVNMWIDFGSAIIDTILSSERYIVPVDSSARAYQWLSSLNAKYAASQVEMSRTTMPLGLGERTRGIILEKEFWDEINKLVALDLTGVGIYRDESVGIFVSGTRVDSKRANDYDSNRVRPKYRKDMFNFPETIRDSNQNYTVSDTPYTT